MDEERYERRPALSKKNQSYCNLDQDLWEHLQTLRWYGEHKLANERLLLVAAKIEDKEEIEELEKEWLNEDKYWNHGYVGTSYGYRGADYYRDFAWD